MKLWTASGLLASTETVISLITMSKMWNNTFPHTENWIRPILKSGNFTRNSIKGWNWSALWDLQSKPLNGVFTKGLTRLDVKSIILPYTHPLVSRTLSEWVLDLIQKKMSWLTISEQRFKNNSTTFSALTSRTPSYCLVLSTDVSILNCHTLSLTTVTLMSDLSSVDGSLHARDEKDELVTSIIHPEGTTITSPTLCWGEDLAKSRSHSLERL